MDLVNTDFSQYVFLNRLINGGHQIVLKFPNGFGASVIRGPYSYGGDKGLYEIGIVEFNESGEDYSLTYDTSITDDVLGYLTKEECMSIFGDILRLTPPNQALDSGRESDTVLK